MSENTRLKVFDGTPKEVEKEFNEWRKEDEHAVIDSMHTAIKDEHLTLTVFWHLGMFIEYVPSFFEKLRRIEGQLERIEYVINKVDLTPIEDEELPF